MDPNPNETPILIPNITRLPIRPSFSSSYFSASTDPFSVELLISGHGSMRTKIQQKYAAEDIVLFDTSISTSMFSFAPTGYACILAPDEEIHYKKFLIDALSQKIQLSPNIQEIDRSTFGDMIVASQQLHGKYSEHDDIDGIKQRCLTVLPGHTQHEKNFNFFEKKEEEEKEEEKEEENSEIQIGIFVLKPIVLRTATINAGTNLLELRWFFDFMNEVRNKYILKIDDPTRIGYIAFNLYNKEVCINLSDIISFFEYLKCRNNTITSLNILDLTCSSISDERTRRRVSRVVHSSVRTNFGGKRRIRKRTLKKKQKQKGCKNKY
jgi:hypothetical protein